MRLLDLTNYVRSSLSYYKQKCLIYLRQALRVSHFKGSVQSANPFWPESRFGGWNSRLSFRLALAALRRPCWGNEFPPGFFH